MARVSTRSNPTELKEIDKGRVSISISEVAGRRYFNLTRLDLERLGLEKTNRIICIARAGKTSQRFNLGSLEAWQRNSLPLDDLDRTESLRFRIIIHDANSPQLTASAENLRPLDESQSESLLPMEPAELGQLLWRLDINEEGPVLKFNMAVFPSAAVENYLPFGALVLPEALRRVMEAIAAEPERLTDESDCLSAWAPWLEAMGMGSLADDADEDEKREWCDGVVDAFCARHLFAARLAQELSTGGIEHD